MTAWVLFALAVASCSLPTFAHAADAPAAKPEGLLISPVQHEVKVASGKQANDSIVIANQTTQPIFVTLTVKQFSVTGLSYDYSFSKADNSWIHLGQTQLNMQPGQSQTIPYTVAPDAQATPGGYYYSIIASTSVKSGDLPSTLQAASLLFITIDGKLVQTGTIKHVLAPRLVVSKQFDVSIDALNTGNVYYFAAVSGQVRGWFTGLQQTPSSHLLIPDKTRRITSSVKSPLLPGIYPLQVDYTADTGTKARASQLIIFIPPWFIALVLAGILLTSSAVRRRKRLAAPTTDNEQN